MCSKRKRKGGQRVRNIDPASDLLNRQTYDLFVTSPQSLLSLPLFLSTHCTTKGGSWSARPETISTTSSDFDAMY